MVIWGYIMDSGPDFFLEVFCLAIYGSDAESEAVVDNVLLTYNDEVDKGSTLDGELTKFYIKLIGDIKSGDTDLDNAAEVETLLLKFEQHESIKDNPKILSRIEKIIANRINITDSRVDRLKVKIKRWLLWVNGNRKLKRLFHTSQKVTSTSDTMVQDLLFGELISYAKDLTKTYEDMPASSSVAIDYIDMSCPNSVKRGLESYKRKRVVKGFKLGLQGVGKMFGGSNGPVPGEYGAIAALSHHYKSGLLMDFARWLTVLNTPRVLGNKPAAIVFISLENEIYENLMMMFKAAYSNHHGHLPDDLSDDAVTTEVNKIFASKGYKLMLYRKDGDEFGYDEWKALHEEISEKYTINASILDYVGLMALDENSRDNTAKQRQQMVGKLKNYCNRSSIFGLTGLQLEGEAERLAASGVTNVVKKFTGLHLADSKGVRRELDFLIFGHIETNHLDVPYFTMYMNKHKYVHDTPSADKYCAYPFVKDIGLQDDIGKPFAGTKDIYSDGGAMNDQSTDTLF